MNAADSTRRLSSEWSSRLFRATASTSATTRRSTGWALQGAHLDRVNHTVSHAWRTSTTQKYSKDILDFLRWCDANTVPLHNRLPASEDLLCAYASSFAGTLAGSSIRNKCAAVRKWHISNGLSYAGGTQLAYVIKGAETLRPLSSVRPPRSAFTADMLSALSGALNPASPEDICILLVACIAFWGQIRLGELLPNREALYDPKKFPSWADLRKPNASGSRILHLPHTKLGGTRGEDVIIARQAFLDPISCLDLHHSVNGTPNHIIASYRDPGGASIALTCRKFLRRVNNILSTLHYPHISGHCFRIGGTTHLLLSGVPPDVVRMMGRWSSDSFLRYWRSLEIIAPMYAELLRPVMVVPGTRRPSP
ncbi:hypothetical protein D9615_008401 [Tricholomella constricta]|uniref:DNA breaking-rejoining enzyme n=1 Tax=Tricholomella constricta TaxID=117010 RepID=A0A8H5HDH4_9AGAR|nr:hypothetical protein D9615_008401 [Tricholomella constricta]